MNNISIKRIEWIDIYKALAIILMVIGHSSERFNGYIYQFHMAAFFFISGFTASLQKKSFFKILVSRFLTLIVPLLIFIVLGASAIKFIPEQKRMILFDIPYLGIAQTIFVFFKTGDIYIQFLGSTWFLPVLFGIYPMAKLMIDIASNKTFYYLLSVIFYAIGYYLCKNKICPKLSFIPIDLVHVCQFLFATGF